MTSIERGDDNFPVCGGGHVIGIYMVAITSENRPSLDLKKVAPRTKL